MRRVIYILIKKFHYESTSLDLVLKILILMVKIRVDKHRRTYICDRRKYT